MLKGFVPLGVEKDDALPTLMMTTPLLIKGMEIVFFNTLLCLETIILLFFKIWSSRSQKFDSRHSSQ